MEGAALRFGRFPGWSPYLNGKTEWSHRIDDEEFYRQLEGMVISTAEEFNQRLQE